MDISARYSTKPDHTTESRNAAHQAACLVKHRGRERKTGIRRIHRWIIESKRRAIEEMGFSGCVDVVVIK